MFGFDGMGKGGGVWEEGVGGRNMLRGGGKIGVMVVKGYRGLWEREVVEDVKGKIEYEMLWGMMIEGWLGIRK